MDKLVFLEDDKCVIWATEDGRDSCRGCVVLQDGTVGHGAMHATEDQMREAFALYRKHTGQQEEQPEEHRIRELECELDTVTSSRDSLKRLNDRWFATFAGIRANLWCHEHTCTDKLPGIVAQLRQERDTLLDKVDALEHGCGPGWVPFDPTSPPPKGDYWCEVPELKLRDGGCLCRALYWTGEHWEGPGGEYKVARFIPEMLPQLHGRGMDECRDQWKLDAAIARIRELESGIGELSKRCEEAEGCTSFLLDQLCDAQVSEEDRASDPTHWDNNRAFLSDYLVQDYASHRGELVAKDARIRELEAEVSKSTKMFELVSAERNMLVRKSNETEREIDSMALRIDRLSAELAKPEDVRLREVTEAMDGRAVMFDGIAERVRHELRDLDRWIARSGNAERELAEVRRMHSKLHDALCRDHMHTRTQDEHECALEVIAELLKQNSIQEGSRNEQVSMVRTMQELPK